MTLRQFFRRRYAPVRLAAGSPGTIQQYEVALNHLEHFRGHDPTLGELDAELVAGCLAALVGRGRSPATVNKIRAHVLAVWRYAIRRGLITRPPDVDRFREPKRVPEAWTIDQFSAILQAASKTPGRIDGVPASVWWPALLLVLYETGLRITPIMRLGRAQFDATAGTLFVPAELQKQKADQLLYLSHDVAAAVAEVLEAHSREWILPWPWDRSGPQWAALNRHYRRILRRAGLPTGRRDLFHRVRRTTASYIEAAGGNAQYQLGHSSRAVTEAYLDPRICRTTRQVDLLPRPDPAPVQQRMLF